MKKVLATLLAVLLLTCVFATVAMADPVYTKGWNGHTYVGNNKPSECPYGDGFVRSEWKNLGEHTIQVTEGGMTVKYEATKWSARCKECKARLYNPFTGKVEWGECLFDHMFTIYVLGDMHQWDEGTVTTEPTCTETGVKTFMCKVDGCTETKTESIPVKPDNHPATAIELRDMCGTHDDTTCEYHQNYCIKCWATDGEAEEHIFGDWETVTEATETTDGLKKKTCACDHFVTETIPATGHEHSWQEDAREEFLASPAKCLEPAMYYYSCECGEKDEKRTFEYGDPLGHDYTDAEWKFDHDTQGGTHQHYALCTRTNCDDHANSAKHEICDGTGNAWNYWNPNKIDWEYHYKDCVECGEPVAQGEHDWSESDVPATCLNAGEQKRTCKVCGLEKTDPIDALGHNFVRTYPHKDFLKSEATCTQPAVYFKSCTRCGVTSEGTDYEATFTSGEAKSHEYGDTDWVTDGPANHKHFCLRYDNREYDGVICDAASIEATMETEPHTWGEWHAVANMWNVEERQCTKCTEKQTRTVGCSHMWTVITREPTCLEDGYQADKCIKCGLIVREKVLPALGHDWGEWMTVTEPTTEMEGLEKRVCKRDPSHVETRPIAMLEPTATPTVEPTVEPTVKPTKKPGKTDIPKTGDNSRFGYAYLMIAAAAAGLTVLAATRRKEGDK